MDELAPSAATPVSDRPRERVWRSGPHSIGDNELVALLLGSGVRDHSAIDVARELVRSAGGIATLSRSSPRELSQVSAQRR